MNRTYRILPTYTGDVSGICSALYEMGGMVVMHDPSGCNSTYNTHDETRWYRKDSLIYISGISEMDAILGADDYFVEAVVAAAQALSPKFIALACSPIPYLNGTDFPGLARLIEAETGIPAFFVRSNGMHDYVAGAGEAFYEIAAHFVKPAETKQEMSVNILGLTPMDFAAHGSEQSLRQILSSRGWQVISCWGGESSLEEISDAGTAAVNLVVSATGLRAAQLLQEVCGIPYVAGIPIVPFADMLLSDLWQAARDGRSRISCLTRGTASGAEVPVYLIGEPVTMGSIAAALQLLTGRPARVLCPLEKCEALCGESDAITVGEEGAEAALSHAEFLVADPMYRHIMPKNCRLFELPHLAMSGRCFRRNFRNLFEPFLNEWSEQL